MTQLRFPERASSYYWRAFLYGIGISLLFFLPFILWDDGYFLFYGDFNVQQVPFYQMCHDAIRSGNLGWSWTTDLGANFIGSYTFYLLGSPFFWLTIPFPSAAVPHLMGPLLVLKFGCASLTGFIYLKRYVRTPDYAVLGGMLYAFSGFSVYNIFFNHFHEAIVVFPLLLWALDEYMATKRRGVFALLVFASCFMNYYFFVGQVVFCVIYFFLRLIVKDWRIGLRDFALLACEAVLGLLCSCVLLIPTVLCVVQNPRVDNPPNGWGALLYGWNQRYVHILECFFFPPDIPARPNFTPDSESKWASLGAWLPLFSMTGVFATLQARRKSWIKTLLPILFLMAFVPILNSSFQLFNSSYYARWFYMLTLMMSLATVTALENPRADWKRAIKWTLGFTLGIALPIGLMVKTTTSGDEETMSVGLEAYPSRFWAYVAIAVLSLLLLAVLMRDHPMRQLRQELLNRRGRVFFPRRFGVERTKRFARSCMCGVAVIAVVYSLYFITLGKTQSSDNHDHMIPYSLNGGKDLQLDTSNCRIDVYDGMDNQAMFFQMPTIQAFHSIVPGSIMEFYPTIGVQRDVGSRPDVKYYGLRGLTSCRWLLDPITSGETFEQDGKTEMPGWKYVDTRNGFDIWENQYFIPMGFCYDSYITREEYDRVSEDNRNLLLLKTMVLDDEQVLRYGDILNHFEEIDSVAYTQEGYFADCLARRSMACSTFERDNSGFTATISTDKDRLVFFSVPSEGGWTATVNGEPAQIEQVNVGFMAVRVPEGESTIRFDYETPGLKLGACVTAGAFLLLGIYWLVTRRFDRAHPPKRRAFRVKEFAMKKGEGTE